MIHFPGSGHLKTLACIAFVLFALPACGRDTERRYQGYIEGEYVYVSSPLPGALRELKVERGSQVKAGELLFALEDVLELSARDEAARRLAQAAATLEDLKKGKRPSEMESLEAQLKQARAALILSENEYKRRENLLRTGSASREDLDRARSSRDQDTQKVAQLEADLRTARMGSRSDQVAAAEAGVKAQEAALARAEWDLSQKRQTAPQAGLVFDTLYRPGEWVSAGRPVVALLPPGNIKIRAFLPESVVSTVGSGDPLEVAVDGLPEPLIARISFISPRAEYTQPLIYSRETREKLVYMIEGTFKPEEAGRLHPGQPVDIKLTR